MNEDLTIFVMGADTPTGLTTGRSLKKLPVTVVGLFKNDDSVTLESNCWDRTFKISEDVSDQFLDAIRILKEEFLNKKAMILFTGDEQVIEYWNNGKDLEKYFIVPVTNSTHGKFLMDKAMFHQWAIQNNVNVPPTIIIKNNKDLELSKSFDYFPCVLKPMVRMKEWNEVYPNKKLFKFYSKEAFNEFIDGTDIFEYSQSYVLQKWIPGGDESVYFVLYVNDCDGRILGRIGGQKHLQWPLGEGSTAMCEVCNDEKLLRSGDALFRNLKVTGLNSVEFKKDYLTGEFYVTEPTVGRNDYQSGLSLLGCKNLTQLLVESISEEGIGSLENYSIPKSGMWIDENILIQCAREKKFFVFRIFLQLLLKNKFKIIFIFFSLSDIGPIRKYIHLKIKKGIFR